MVEYPASGDARRSMELLWGQRAAGSRGPKQRLSVERITTAAVGLADVDGVDKVSMRRVADSLGSSAMSLYTYVPGKAELLDLMVDSVLAPDLSVQQTFEASEFRRALTPEIAAQMTALMVANVRDGAASGATIDDVDVAGKTGTAEHGPGDPYTLWFTGFAPADDPRVAVAVMVQDGGGLGQSGTSDGIASPIAKRVIEAVLSR